MNPPPHSSSPSSFDWAEFTRLVHPMQVAIVACSLGALLLCYVAGVVSAYRHQGLALAKRSSREGWATLVMKRGGAAARPRPLYKAYSFRAP